MSAVVNQKRADRSLETYRAAVVSTFAFLKGTTQLDDLWAKSVRLAGDAGYLVPVCELHAGDDALVARLAAWRERNAFAFPTQFPVTVEGTATWLRRGLLDVEDRLLFLVVDRHGRPVGHLGFANALHGDGQLEVDNVVRGEDGVAPGLMGAALDALVAWAEETLVPHGIHLRVFADNAHAVGFYERHGFCSEGLVELRRHVDGDRTSYVERAAGDDAPGDRQFRRMRWAPTRPADPDETILTAGPTISARETSYALDATRNGWNAQWNGYLERFAATFADYVGTAHAIPTSSCTGALHLALLACGVGPGDEVIVPDVTWVATANAVAYTGATPVFADVERDSWCLDPTSFRAAITPRTKAVMPVHLYGHPARVDVIAAIAREHGLRVVEDAAPAIGAEVEGRRVGGFGDVAAFSFQGAKLLVAGEGGMLVTSDDEVAERARALWNLGADPGTFWISQLGLKLKLSNVQAAIGLAQLERVEELVEQKRRIFAWYAEGLEGVPGLTLNRETPWARSIYWMTSIRVGEAAGISRDDLRRELRIRRIDTRPVFPAISQYPIWTRRQAPQPEALALGNEGINLPSGHRLRREQVERVCAEIREIVGGGR